MKIIDSVYTLRLIAVFAVIAIHTVPFSFDGWEIADQFTLPIVINQLSRFAVPMFFVLSGYFWIMKIRGGADLARTSKVVVRRIFSVWLFWSVIYLILYNFFSVETYDITRQIKILHWYYWEGLKHPWYLILNGSAGHLWFLISLLMSVAISSVFLYLGQIRLIYVLAVMLFVLALLGKAYAKSLFGFLTDFDLRDGPFLDY